MFPNILPNLLLLNVLDTGPGAAGFLQLSAAEYFCLTLAFTKPFTLLTFRENQSLSRK